MTQPKRIYGPYFCGCLKRSFEVVDSWSGKVIIELLVVLLIFFQQIWSDLCLVDTSCWEGKKAHSFLIRCCFFVNLWTFRIVHFAPRWQQGSWKNGLFHFKTGIVHSGWTKHLVQNPYYFPQRSDMAHHEKDVINAMYIVMREPTNLSWQGLQPRPLKEVAQAGLPFRMFVRYLWFFSEESLLDSLLTSKKWNSAAFFEECQVGEADPEDKKAQCLLTRIQIQRFVFSSVEPGSWVWTSADDLDDLQNLGVPYYAKQWKSCKHHS